MWIHGRYIDVVILITRQESTLNWKEEVAVWLKVTYTDRLETIKLTATHGMNSDSVPFLFLDIETDI